jgi:hypothetical protein
MKTTIQLNETETEIRLNFQHKQFNHLEKMDKSASQHPRLKGITECYLLKEDNSIVGVGNSSCTINDCFCKETGRKISLARAVSTLPKSERKKIWEAYRNRKL